MRLRARLPLLILLCLAPVIGAEAWMQQQVRQQRMAEIRELALHQAESTSARLADLSEGARQMLTMLAGAEEVTGGAPGCGEQLARAVRRFPQYAFVAAVQPGRIVCASSDAVARAGTDWIGELPASGFTAGTVMNLAGAAGPVLPVVLAVPQHADERLVAAISLPRLEARTEKAGLTSLLAGATLDLLDRDGRPVLRAGSPPAALPTSAELAALVHAQAPGVAEIGRDGVLAAYVPAAAMPLGLTTVVSFRPDDQLSAIDRLSTLGLGLLVAAALVAAWVAALAARRLFVRPAERLLAAARNWRAGDLGARASVARSGSEFHDLAASFNSMAEALALREAELHSQALLLESRVADRTRVLSERNNRLQVEIVERARSEAALQKVQRMQAAGRLAGGVAHDFNNLLATVLGSLDLMERRLPNLPPADRDRLAVLIERSSGAVQKAAGLTSRLLAFARREDAGPRLLDLNAIISDLLILAAGTIGRRIEVTANLDRRLWPVHAEPGQVETALVALLLAAREAMADGGALTIATANHTGALAGGPPGAEHALLTISDTGASPRAGRLDDARRGAAAQARTAIREFGGEVRLEAAEDGGMAVSLWFPRAGDPVEDGPVTPAAAPADARLRRRVLLVDDDEPVRHVTADMLRALGCEVQDAPGGAEALALLDGCTVGPDLVVLDYAMPGMNGLEVAEIIRRRRLPAPILLATGYAELVGSAAGQDAVFDAVLRKPFTIRELAGAVMRLCGERRVVGGTSEPV